MQGLTPRTDRLDQNLIMNGNFFLAQRKPSGTVALTGSDAYGVFDRFVAQHYLVTSPTWEKEDLGSSLPLHQRYCAKFSGNFASGAVVSMSQRIESIVASLAYNENISIAFEVYSESCTHMRILGRVPTSIDNHATYNTAIFDQNVAISALGSWVEVKLENVSVGATVVNGLAITTNFINPSITGSTKLHKIRNLRVTIGANAASRFCFNGRNQIEEVHRCNRYYETSYVNQAPGTSDGTYGEYRQFPSAAGTQRLIVYYRAEKRLPNHTFNIYSTNSGTIDNFYNSAIDVAVSYSRKTTNSATFYASASNTDWAYHWVAQAEL